MADKSFHPAETDLQTIKRLHENAKRLRFFRGQAYDTGMDDFLLEVARFMAYLEEKSALAQAESKTE
jgi:hypothetical protein